MNVRVPAVAPTTPPDMGASTNTPPALATEAATSRDEDGSIVEQSMKRRWVDLGERVWERMAL